MDTVLEVSNLKTYFYIEQGVVRAVDGVSFTLQAGKTLGIVGESGCGKSVTSRTIMRLLSPSLARIVDGSIKYYPADGPPVELTQVDPYGDRIRDIRGNEIAMIFQEPMTSLNPVYTIGQQIMEAILLHQDVSKDEARARAIDVLRLVGIPLPEQRVDQYPHEFSGGMRQRAMIAMALSCNPRILIADEPTTALDVTIEAQILELIQQIQQDNDMALIMITHDLNVIGEVADHVIVMYLGQVVESAPVDDIFDQPKHPYTQGLLNSLPMIGRGDRLEPITGSVPGPHERPRGCPFAPRCPQVMDRCRAENPPSFVLGPASDVACWLYEEAAEPSHDSS
ncbi:MAG: ABC transporter ATP-binding protein [Chloroflexota bacterium]|nr:ABC transporter ATP-binding protein [Chloroflexota bacterium]MDE2949053.1 ABC transporter ATP-binding protein [Chloroflexota bacterium]